MPSDTSKPKLQLASTEKTWIEFKSLLAQHVEQICGNYNVKTVEAFMFVIDCLTNDAIDEDEQQTAAEYVQNMAFAYSRELPIAREQYLNTINPGRVQGRRKVVRA